MEAPILLWVLMMTKPDIWGYVLAETELKRKSKEPCNGLKTKDE